MSWALAKRVGAWVGLDRAVLSMAAGRVWSALAGPVTLLLIGTTLTPSERGYYYVFANLLLLQVFLEMGFNQSIIQFASHEFARLGFDGSGRLGGDPLALNRLLTLARLAVRWYRVLGGLLIVGVGAAGHLFLSLQPEGDVVWRLPWWCLCGVAAFNLTTQPFWFLIEGCNQVAAVYVYRAVALVATGVTTWLALWLGAGLYVPALAGAAGLAVSVAFLMGWWRTLVRQFLAGSTEPVRSLFGEVWAFQWRMGLSAASGFLIFNMMPLAVMQFGGDEEAGRMGMSWQLVSALATLATGWISTKAPTYGVLISRRQFVQLDALAFRTTAQAVGIMIAGGLALVVGVVWVEARWPMGDWFLGVEAVAILAAASVVNQVILGQAYYLRAHRQEPFMVLSLINGVATTLGVILAARRWGGLGACAAYALVQWMISPAATWVFLTKRRQWHRA